MLQGTGLFSRGRGVETNYRSQSRLQREGPVGPTVAAIDDNGFSDFYRKEHDGQVRRAYLLLGTSALAHDVVAEAFIAVFRRWDTIDTPGPYLNRCVLNGCRDQHRRGPREQLAAEPEPPVLVTSHDTQPEVADGLADQLLALPFRQRAAIVLRYYGGYSEAEIASLLECRPGTVGSSIHRGLRALRKAITANNGAPVATPGEERS